MTSLEFIIQILLFKLRAEMANIKMREKLPDIEGPEKILSKS